MITRRKFLTHLAAPAGLAVATYGFLIEPQFMLNIVTRKISPPNWTPGLKLRALTITDPHVVEPYMSLARWEKIIKTANDLQPDIVFMLGDYISNIKRIGSPVPVVKTAKAAAQLKAPLGVFSINGNHDWWGDEITQITQQGPPEAQKAFEDAGIPVLANKAVRLLKDGLPFWVTGTDSMIAIVLGHRDFIGFADIEATLAQVTDDAPIIHLAHEPDLFPKIPARVSLTLSGHTHGGQVRIAGYSPLAPTMYGSRFVYGHIVEEGRHLVVSSGLGCSTLPLRFGVPPEISILELS
jgi:uncharacterized protein